MHSHTVRDCRIGENKVFEKTTLWRTINNGYVFATAFGHGKASRVRPLFYANRDLGLGEAQNQAIEEICQQFQKLAKSEMEPIIDEKPEKNNS